MPGSRRDRGKPQARLALPPPRTSSRHLVAGPTPPPTHAARPGGALAVAQRCRLPHQDGEEIAFFRLALMETYRWGKLQAGLPWRSRRATTSQFLDAAGAAKA